MKLSEKMIVVLAIIVVLSFFSGCSDKATGPADTATNGTLEFKMAVWNTFAEGKLLNSPFPEDSGKDDPPVYTCDLIDIRNILYKMEVADGEIIAGEPDNLEWITIYESAELLLNSEKEFSIELPPGNYKAIKLEQSNLMYWVVNYNDTIFEIPSLNASDLDPDAQLVNIFGEEGLFELDDDGLFYLYHSGEKLGTFEIKSGKTTKVTMRLNLMTLDWIDNDNDGVWSDGDEITNWTVPEGIETMADFIVTYDD